MTTHLNACIHMLCTVYTDVKVHSQASRVGKVLNSTLLTELDSVSTSGSKLIYLDPIFFNDHVLGLSNYEEVHQDKICGLLGKSWNNRKFLDVETIVKMVSMVLKRYVLW